MGFLAGFGTGLQHSADLEQQANIAKKAELTKANLDLAQLLLASDDPDNHAKAMAIYSDPSHTFRLDKDHPNLESVKRVMQSLPAAAVPAVASGASPAGMAGMLGTDNSPMAQPGITGDQGMPTPPPVGAPPPGSVPSAALLAPPAAPPSAAMTTNPPATQGGTISPAAALGGAPPLPPANLPPPSPGEKYQAALKAFQSQELPQGGISAAQFAERNKTKLEMARTAASANALFQAGRPEEAIAVLGGKTIIPYETKQMGITSAEKEGEANRGSKEKIAGEKVASAKEIAAARTELAQKQLAQRWQMDLAKLGVSKQRLANSSASGDKAELTRLTKIQGQMADTTQGATSGLVGLERLRDRLNEFTSAPDLPEQAKSFYRLRDAASAEGSRLTQAMNPGVKGQRMNKDRIDAMVAEIMASKTVAGNLLPVLAPEEISKRLDTIDQLIRNSHDESMGLFTAQANARPQVGQAPPVIPLPSHQDLTHAGAPGAAKIPAGAKTATNPTTGQKLYSTDGGKTWQDALTGAALSH